MKNTILTGAAALALATPAFAGSTVTYVTPEPEPSNLGLSGDLSLGYQSQYEFRGIGTSAADLANDISTILDDSTDTDNAVIANIGGNYAFTENFSLVAGARVITLPDGNLDHNTYRAGAVWKQDDCYSFELGYQYQDFRSSWGNEGVDEIYANFGIICPLTGAKINLFYAHGFGGIETGNDWSTGRSLHDLMDGDYLELSARKSFELSEWASAEFTAGVSYGFDYWTDTNDFNSWYVALALPLKATDHLTVTPYVAYTDGLAATEDIGAVTDFAGYTEGDEVIWGVEASVSF